MADSAKYLHPGLVSVFLLLFALMSLIGMIKLFRERKFFGVGLLFVSTLVFTVSTWVAATL